VAHLLFADGNECGEEIDDAFEIACAAPGPSPFVVKRIKAMAALRVEDDKVFLSPAFLCVANPIAGLFRLGGEDQTAHAGYSQKPMSDLPAAATTFAGARCASYQSPFTESPDVPKITFRQRENGLIEDVFSSW